MMEEKNAGIEPVGLVMVLDDLSHLPYFPPPPGLSFRGFQDGDAELWACIETSAGEFAGQNRAIEHFHGEFGRHGEELLERCLFVETEAGEAVGTAMAWYGAPPSGGLAGRLHWVGIRKEYQGRGIGRSLVSRAMALLATLHDRAYLTTQRSSLAAIKIYLDFGFRPFITERLQEEAWTHISRKLGVPNLDIGFDSSGGDRR
jgi:GNAT superfamily N-acetyltransferase